ncbi:MAG TPA: hypothetical protein PKB04_12680 [Phenylobacterium sp.]|nr:hypothetical protein [Phenylobacterium sp.]
MIRTFGAVTLATLWLAACSPAADDASAPAGGQGGALNLYTSRHYDADLALYEAFTAETGIKVNRIEGNPDQLIARMQAEGPGSPADVFLAADAGALWRGCSSR